MFHEKGKYNIISSFNKQKLTGNISLPLERCFLNILFIAMVTHMLHFPYIYCKLTRSNANS